MIRLDLNKKLSNFQEGDKSDTPPIVDLRYMPEGYMFGFNPNAMAQSGQTNNPRLFRGNATGFPLKAGTEGANPELYIAAGDVKFSPQALYKTGKAIMPSLGVRGDVAYDRSLTPEVREDILRYTGRNISPINTRFNPYIEVSGPRGNTVTGGVSFGGQINPGGQSGLSYNVGYRKTFAGGGVYKAQDAEPLTLEQRAEAMGENPEYARNVQKMLDEGATIQELAARRIGTVSGLSKLFPDAEMGTAPERSSSRSTSSSSSRGGGSDVESRAAEFNMSPEKFVGYYNRGAKMINEGKSIDDLVNMRYGTRGSLTRMFPTAPTETVKVEETPEESSNLDNLSQDEINALWVQMGNDIKDAPKAKNPEGNRIMKDFQPIGYLPDLEDEDESLKNLNEDLDYFQTEEYREFAEDIYDSEEEAVKATEEITNRLIGQHANLILRNKEKEKEYRERTPTFTGERPQYNVNIQPEQTQSSTFTSSYTPDLLQFDPGLTMQADNLTVANNFNFPLETNYSRPGEDFVTTNSLADRDVAVFGLDYTPLKLDINLTDIEESGVTSNLFGTASAPQRAHDELENIVKPFAESLANNKEKIMDALYDRGTPIASYEYDAIAPLVFGVFGAESGLGDTKTGLENILYTGTKATVGGRSADPEAELELYEMIDKAADPFVSIDPANYSVGWTQLNWNANLTPDEEELLAELGITSPTDLIDPELSALATMALFASRKSGRAEMSDAELLDTWNRSPSYDAKVNKFASFITPYSQLPNAKDKGAIPSVTTTGSYSDSHATGLKNTFVDFLESLVYKQGGKVPGGRVKLDLEKKLGVDINKLDPLPIGTSYKSRKFFQKNPLAAIAYGKNPFRKAGSPPRDLLA